MRISIDDFGTGYSSLAQIKRLPVDELKIDRLFVQEVGADEDSRIIIDAIISLAGSLRLETVAEGVETNLQLDYLLDRGCHIAQGYLFGMPMAPEQVEPLLRERMEDVSLPLPTGDTSAIGRA